MLVVNKIHTYYSQAKILRDVSMHVNAGECVALLGRNGAGKSTTLKTVMGLVKPKKGSVEFDGKVISGLPNYKIARLGVGYVPEDRKMFPKLTVLENLDIGIKDAKSSKHPWSVKRVYELFPKLEELKDREAGHLSGGEQQMVTVARTLMGNPKLLLLDEPSEGLAPIIVQNIINAVNVLKEEGIAILLSEQNQRAAESLCERAYVLERGRVVYDGGLAELLADTELKEHYLSVA